MNIAIEILNIVTYAGVGLVIGIILNSKNTIGLINALTSMFTSTFNSAAATIR